VSDSNGLRVPKILKPLKYTNRLTRENPGFLENYVGLASSVSLFF